MARRLVRRRQAERDLGEQVEYIARERPAAARRYLIAVEEAFRDDDHGRRRPRAALRTRPPASSRRGVTSARSRFQANMRIITASDTLLGDLVNIIR
jgi:plasmid stabilization system protein ParE